MIHLHLFVEGRTELNFVLRILQPFLGYDRYTLFPIQTVTKQDEKRGRIHKGGFVRGSGSYEKVKKQINNRTKECNKKQEKHVFTTMFDFYALPSCFPGYTEAEKIADPYSKVKKLEESLGKDIDDYRFIPYIQLHEFEAMIFVDSGQLIHEYPERASEILSLSSVLEERNVNGNPELINEDPTTAPSKRIIAQIPGYDKAKANASVNTVEKIGIDAIRKQCPHFNEWLYKLENLK